jgi:hypothetical protein
MEIYIFWDVMACSLLVTDFSEEHVAPIFRVLTCYILHADFLIGLFLDSEDGGDMFL